MNRVPSFAVRDFEDSALRSSLVEHRQCLISCIWGYVLKVVSLWDELPFEVFSGRDPLSWIVRVDYFVLL